MTLSQSVPGRKETGKLGRADVRAWGSTCFGASFSSRRPGHNGMFLMLR